MEHLESFVPLLQTTLWIVLVAGIVWRFHRPLHSLLEALRRRVEAGSRVKAGPFEIGELFQPLNTYQQRQKLEKDLQDLVPKQEATLIQKEAVSPSSLQRRYLQAEDMALRKIQATYQSRIIRALTAGGGLVFDGAFARDGKLHVIEVKYSIHRTSENSIRRRLDGMVEGIQRNAWKNVRII